MNPFFIIQQEKLRTLALLAIMLTVSGAVAFVLLGWVGLVAGSAMLALASMVNVNGELLMRVQGARPVPAFAAPDLHRIIEQLAARAGIPKPRVYLMDIPIANAMATESSDARGIVAVTRGLLQTLHVGELEAVLAHEMSHLQHNDTRLARLSGSISRSTVTLIRISAWLAFFLAVINGTGVGWWLVTLSFALFIPAVLHLIESAMSRTREFAADANAVKLTANPLALASALQKLESQRGGIWGVLLPRPQISDWLSSHPATRERVARLLAMARGAGAGQSPFRPAVPSANSWRPSRPHQVHRLIWRPSAYRLH